MDANQRHYKPCSRPTDCEPGSPEKLKILTQRWESGEEFWHEEDACYSARVQWNLQTVRVEALIAATAERSRL